MDLEIAPGVVVTFARPAIMEVRSPAVARPTIDGHRDRRHRATAGAAGGRPADGTL